MYRIIRKILRYNSYNTHTVSYDSRALTICRFNTKLFPHDTYQVSYDTYRISYNTDNYDRFYKIMY